METMEHGRSGRSGRSIARVAVVVAHAAYVVTILGLVILVLAETPSAPDAAGYRPDPLFDNLGAWIRGLLAILALIGAVLVAAGAALWLKTGRRAFGVAMDLSIGLTAYLALAARDAFGVAAIVLALVAAATLVLGPRSKNTGISSV